MNCFQNLYLWLSETAVLAFRTTNTLLWIAFKICIFDFQKQLSVANEPLQLCCELLSKFVSLTFRNSVSYFTSLMRLVVNCFQNLYLWLSETAVQYMITLKGLLWIAFKICIFDFQKQRLVSACFFVFCCELLSKFVSLTFRNSIAQKE